ncbi:hypothetical protein APA_1163 [Pseudanabaena sp. lw0831]|nr:hypothetical protein APA_1163 [Pseudanabaena sp. lw0831]
MLLKVYFLQNYIQKNTAILIAKSFFGFSLINSMIKLILIFNITGSEKTKNS